jgi:dTDP-4-dehydrorhamnose reductase
MLHQIGATGAPTLRIVVTGSSGLLGRILVNLLKNDYEVIGIDKHALTNEPDALALDITQTPGALESMVKLRPSVVVHTAAETNVDLCETDHEHARMINVEGTANVAEACAKSGAKMIFISTDYVFDGTKGNYSEIDQPNPISFYGLSKLEAERIVIFKLPNALVMRASVLYGWHPSKLNFGTWVINGLRKRQTLRVVKDHINSPTLANNLAMAIRVAIERGSEGLLHVAGSERISRFDFARKIAKSFDLDESLLVPVEMRDLNWVAKRPRDSSLDVAKAEKELGIQLLGVNRGLAEMARTEP